MNDTRTEQEKHEAWIQALNICFAKGWYNVSKWIFKSPSGTLHDLSAADLSKLENIEREKYFLIK